MENYVLFDERKRRMAYDEALAQRIREVLEGSAGLIEKKMFGGVGFMIQGNMACGVNKEDLIVRVGPDGYEQALNQAHTRVFDMTGRPMKGWITVSAEGYEDQRELTEWVNKGVDFARSLPPK
jgi:TfoX/Sxy family transcriptional regulator of competence genes